MPGNKILANNLALTMIAPRCLGQMDRGQMWLSYR